MKSGRCVSRISVPECGPVAVGPPACYARAKSLKTFPNRGNPGHRSGTRELALLPLPYVIVYAVKADAVEILHVYHGAQDWR